MAEDPNYPEWNCCEWFAKANTIVQDKRGNIPFDIGLFENYQEDPAEQFRHHQYNPWQNAYGWLPTLGLDPNTTGNHSHY